MKKCSKKRIVGSLLTLLFGFFIFPLHTAAQIQGPESPRKEKEIFCSREVTVQEDSETRAFQIKLCMWDERVEKAWEAGTCSAVVPHYEKAGEMALTVYQDLDPRFWISPVERKRIKDSGGNWEQRENDGFQVFWEFSLPGSGLWEVSFTVHAQNDFLGGNEILLDGEESGVYRQNRRVLEFSPAKLNVPLAFRLTDLNLKLFLGERLPKRIGGEDLETAMLGGLPNWYGKGETGKLTLLWRKEGGALIGSAEQLLETRPKGYRRYLFIASYSPEKSGKGGIGPAVTEQEAFSILTVDIVQGSLILRAVTESEKLCSPLFLLEGEGLSLYSAGKKERKGEKTVFHAAFTGLPYGKYRVSQINPSYEEVAEEYWVGAHPENDTLTLERNAPEIWLELSAGEEKEGLFQSAAVGETFRVSPLGEDH